MLSFMKIRQWKILTKKSSSQKKVTMDVTIDPSLQFIGEKDTQNEGDTPEAIPNDSDEENIPS